MFELVAIALCIYIPYGFDVPVSYGIIYYVGFILARIELVMIC